MRDIAVKEKEGRETGHDPLNPFRVLHFSSERGSDFMAAALKGAVLIFLLVSISLVLCSAFFSEPWFRCPSDRIARTRNMAHICAGGATPAASAAVIDIRNDSPFGPTNISHIVFGIGGSASTWKDRRHYSQLWWQPKITRGFVWLDKEPDPDTQWPDNSPPYRVSSNWKQFEHKHSDSAVRIARVIVDSFRVGFPNVRWFVMGDDDTVFLPDNLVTVLAKYDHRQMYYIGGNSESIEQDAMHSYGMAFGGGGFAISYTLAEELVKVMDGCLNRYFYFYGSDQRVWACVSEFGVSLTRESGFHQLDIRGDPYGLLAAHPKTPLVSLHHLDYVKPLFPNLSQHQSLESLMAAYRVDPSRTVQQCFCYYQKRGWLTSILWSISISWGYTVQIYPSLLTANDLEMPLQTFQTWRSWSNGPFTFNTRPVSPDPCERPVVFYLDGVKEVAAGETLTSYKKYFNDQANVCKKADHARTASVDRVIVYAPRMDPEDWSKVVRRQCCEIDSLKGGTLKVSIRRCEHGETVTI